MKNKLQLPFFPLWTECPKWFPSLSRAQGLHFYPYACYRGKKWKHTTVIQKMHLILKPCKTFIINFWLNIKYGRFAIKRSSVIGFELYCYIFECSINSRAFAGLNIILNKTFNTIWWCFIFKTYIESGSQ